MNSKALSSEQPTIVGYQVTLRPVGEPDLNQMRSWRNSDSVRQQMLSTDAITEEQQTAWFTKIKRDPTQLHWIIEYRDEPIGSTNVKTRHHQESVVTAKELEPGLYIGHPAYQGNLLAFAPTLALYDYCFNVVGTELFHAVVKATNKPALNYNKQLGYEIVSEGDLVALRLHQRDYERQTAVVKRLLSRSRKT